MQHKGSEEQLGGDALQFGPALTASPKRVASTSGTSWFLDEVAHQLEIRLTLERSWMPA
jgi:hypothetical protein